MNIKEQIRAEIERQMNSAIERQNANPDMPKYKWYLYEGAKEFCTDLLGYLDDSFPERPKEGLDVTDFCKPIDPGIAQCVADHWWEMIGEESTNKKSVEGLEEAAEEYNKQVIEETKCHHNALTYAEGYENALLLIPDAFIAGAEWQEKQDLKWAGEIHKNGYNLCKEQLLKDAVKIEVKEDAGGFPIVPLDAIELYDYENDKPLAKAGDKVKVIVIKED